MHRLAFASALAALALVLVAPAAEPLAPGAHKLKLEHGGRTRTYELVLPTAAKEGKPLPLVIALHGGLGTGEGMRDFAGLDAIAEREGFAVVYPDGTSPGPWGRVGIWNAGLCCGAAHRRGVDDVGFIGAMLDALAERFPLDKRRVYVTGLSNGAMMAYRLACEMSDRIAAIAPVAGTMNVAACEPSRPVPVMHFHGTADRNVPYEGGRGALSIARFEYASVADTIARWRAIDGCAEEIQASRVPDTVADETTVRIQRWPDCKGGSEVALVTVQGGGHTWPGGPYALKFSHKLGPVTMDLSASEAMWAFFSRHALDKIT